MMVDLMVTPQRHVQVATAAGSVGTGGARFAAGSLFEHVLQSRFVSARILAPITDNLPVDPDAGDRTDRMTVRGMDEISSASRRGTRSMPTIDRPGDAITAPPAHREDDPDHPAPPDNQADRRLDSETPPSERRDQRPRKDPVGEPEARPAADPAEGSVPILAAAAAPPMVAGTPESGALQGLASAIHSGASTPSALESRVPLARGAEATAETPPAMTVPAQATASVIREADILHSQPSAALIPTAVLAANSGHGSGARLRAPSPAAGATAVAPAATEAITTTGSTGVLPAPMAAGAVGGQQGAPVVTGAAVAGGADGLAAAALQGAAVPSPGSGQIEPGQNLPGGSAAPAMVAAAIVAPTGTSTATAAGRPESPSPAGIGEGTAIGSIQTPLQSGRATSASAVPPAPSMPQRMISEQVSVHIRKAVHEGADRIEIRLKPEALGRVDVRLELAADNRVVATITADQRYTLELLRADARSLERALQEAGLQTDGGSLNFNLRGGEDGRSGGGNARTATSSMLGGESHIGSAAEDLPANVYRRLAGRPDGIDIHA